MSLFRPLALAPAHRSFRSLARLLPMLPMLPMWGWQRHARGLGRLGGGSGPGPLPEYQLLVRRCADRPEQRQIR